MVSCHGPLDMVVCYSALCGEEGERVRKTSCVCVCVCVLTGGCPDFGFLMGRSVNNQKGVEVYCSDFAQTLCKCSLHIQQRTSKTFDLTKHHLIWRYWGGWDPKSHSLEWKLVLVSILERNIFGKNMSSDTMFGLFSHYQLRFP